MNTKLGTIPVIDVDTHITEPADLWTSRVPRKWGDEVLHVRANPKGGLGWYIGDTKVYDAPAGARGAWVENAAYPPATPASYEEIHPGSYSPKPRLEWMDKNGVYAQVIYPNVGGFGAGRFLKIKDDELRLQSVQAYNDFLTEWCAEDANRLIAIGALPLWDIDATVRELQRVADAGHRGVLMSNQPETMDLPRLADEYWDPLWHAAEDAGISVNFHIGGGEVDVSSFGTTTGHTRMGAAGSFARQAVLFFMDNGRAVTELITAGVCHRHPKLQLVSVESGIGWVPFLLEAMDWQWVNTGVHIEHPEMTMMPSEYFRQNWYACFWFEREAPRRMLDFIGVDNVLFETDFPHPTSLTPGPTSIARPAYEHIMDALSEVPEEWARKVLWENPARLYRVEPPAAKGAGA